MHPGTLLDTAFTRALNIEIPLICGAMYPCSNPELVAAASEAGGIGIIQPLSMVYVHGHEYKEGLALIKSLTSKPVGLNVLTEKSSSTYQKRMEAFVEMSLEAGIRFFVTSLGNPKWIVDRTASVGGIVYHDVTEAKWAKKAADGGVHGLIAVNARAGGHAGPRSPEALLAELRPFNLPVICAGGIGDEADFVRALEMGYAGVQMGTRFIATPECRAHDSYKQALVRATSDDIVLTERITGVPVAVIRTPYVERIGTRAGPIARWMLKGRKTKHWMRSIYAARSFWSLKRSSLREMTSKDYYQAGKSVDGITEVEPTAVIIRRFADAALGSRRKAAKA